jgi:hypothetical protein
MQDKARNESAPGDLSKLSGSGNCSERKICGMNLNCCVGLQGEHGAVSGGTKTRGGSAGGRSEELIGCADVPYSQGSARSGTERKKNVIAGGVALDKRGAGQTADFLLRSQLHRWRTGLEIHLCEACGARARRAALTAETHETPPTETVTPIPFNGSSR